ncbi:MAG: diguanylate cyclase [Oscillospiraceae bacterium]|nr:diguanylate cyclase [Oscillospiraceae bacterium]
MSSTSDILFDYLRDFFYDPSKANLDIDELDDDYVLLGRGLMFFAECFTQYNELATALAKGDLSVRPPPPENELAAPLKSLHASLKHLTWQTQQVAKGDYRQRVDFMGEFSDAFNVMIEQLSERQQKLEDEIKVTQKKSVALEQSNQLLTNITQNIPQQIIVVDRISHEILFMNISTKNTIQIDSTNLEMFLSLIERNSREDSIRQNIEIQMPGDILDEGPYLSVTSYLLEWDKSSAEAFVINDISAEKSQIKELENYAFRDALTNLHNRSSGMITLSRWMDEKKKFSLIFVDLDNLKYINDVHGHNEGDNYIITASEYLKMFSQEAIVCRIGGDEFMILAPLIGFDDTQERMDYLGKQLEKDPYLEGKDYMYSISFGIAAVDSDNHLPASEILSLADGRMYEHKRSRKKGRGAL